MTGGSDTQSKLRAVFLAFVMVTSVFGATVAFSGTVAAANLNGGGDGSVSYEINGGNAGNVITGSADQELSSISIQDETGGEFRGLVELSFGPAVTINESASTLNTNTVLPSSGAGFSIDSVSVINNSHTLEIDVSGGSSSGERIDIKSGALHVAVDGSQVDTTTNPKELPATIETFSNTLNIRADGGGETGNEGFLDAGVVGTSVPSQATPSVDTVGQNLGDEVQLSDVDAGEIGNGTAITLSIESGTGVTFDQRVDPTDAGSLVVSDAESPGDLNIDDADSDKELDIANATLTDTTLTIPVNSSISGSGHDIFFDTDSNLAFNVSGDATNTDLNVSIAAASPNTGSYQLGAISSGKKQSTNANQVNPNKPALDVNDGNDANIVAATGLNEQDPSPPAGDNAEIAIDTSSASISGDKFLNITTNNSAVTFDTSTEISGTKLRNTVTTQGDIDTLLGGSRDEDIQNVTVTENKIALGVDSDGVSGTSDALSIDLASSNFNLNVSNSPADNTKVQFNATAGPVGFVDSTNVVDLERPDTTFNGGSNATVNVDNDGEQVVIDNSQDTLIISSDDVGGQISDATNVTVTLDTDTGVTFDKSAPTATDNQNDNDGFDVFAHAGTTIDGGDENVNFDVDGNTGQTFTGITVNDNSIEISLADDGGDGPSTSLSSDESIVIDEVPLNATAGASNTTVSVTTNTSDAEVTTELAQIIATSQDTPSNLAIDADGSNNFNDLNNGQVTGVQDPQVDNTVTGAVRVQNSGNFGGATVNLDIVETPDGASGSSLNTTQLTTNQNGVAFYNFTAGDTAGDYVVNATVSETGTGLNVTYTAQPGAIDGVSVTPIENAIAGDSAETGVAALHVNATDANGNKVTGSSPTVGITADNVGISNVEVDNNFRNSVTASNVDSEGINNDGTFSLHSADGSSVVLVKSSQIENVTITAEVSGNSDTGTVTFFDEIGGIDLTLNQSTVEVGDTVAAEATISESDGTTIEVPDVTVNYDDNNDGNTTFDADADAVSATTNGAGVTSVNVTAEQLGSSTINAQSNLRSDSATLDIVENAGAQVQLANVNLDPSSVSANTTNDHDLTFDAVNVSDDGNTDSFTVTIPSAATLESANSVSVVDANGTDVSLSGGPDVSGNEITFDVAPDSSADTRTLSVTANVTVAAPAVENETTADITVDVSDSNNGQASANVTLTVAPAAQPANFTVSGLQPQSANVTLGDSIDVQAQVTNDGGQQGTQAVGFRLDTNQNGTLEASEELVNESVTLGAGNSTTVVFENVSTAGLNITGQTAHGVFSANDSATATITLQEEAGVPADPAERALQAAGVNNASAIEQSDITTLITLRDRGQPANGVDVTQDDITTLITLRDRAQ